jgi:CRP/FNR family transcriptional regulator, anaerobic regulatory protein
MASVEERLDAGADSAVFMTAQEKLTETRGLSAARVACKDCSVFQLCLPRGISEADLARLDGIIKRRRPLEPDQHLYQVGEPFHSIYVVRSGSVKTYMPTPDGGEQVTGFYLPGEIVGLDAVAVGMHSCSARALDTASFCELPFGRLEDLADVVRSLGRRLLWVLGREIHQDHEMLTVLGKPTAEERLAGLLVSFSSRLKQRGFSDREFRLSMSRHDIGSYLGLAVETVSRVFSRFQRQGLLRVDRRNIVLRNLPALKTLAGVSTPSRKGVA